MSRTRGRNVYSNHLQSDLLLGGDYLFLEGLTYRLYNGHLAELWHAV